jgi:2-C-methyl-D-erythritol 4-phosphate cytidylyltransferase
VIDDLAIIVAAAGSGQRFGGHNKLLEPLENLPLFVHCLKTFLMICPAKQIVLVVSSKERDQFASVIKQTIPETEILIVNGGDFRTQSIANGIQQLPTTVNYVAIHDAARPFVTLELIKRCLTEARQHGAAIPAKQVTDTLKRVNKNNQIIETVCRNNLWRVETPQVFDLKLLRQAYKIAEDCGAGNLTEFTDDAAVMEAAGFSVKIVNAPEPNLKITYPEDITAAEIILAQR